MVSAPQLGQGGIHIKQLPSLPYPSYLTHEFGLQLPKSARQWIRWLLLIHIFSSGYGCTVRILGTFLIDTEDADAKWHLRQAVCCFIKRKLNTLSDFMTQKSLFLFNAGMVTQPLYRRQYSGATRLRRKQGTRYFDLPLIACEFIWRGGRSSTTWNNRRENLINPFLQSVCRSRQLCKRVVQQALRFLSVLGLGSEGRSKHWEESCPVTINEDVCIDTDISYGLSNLGRGARSFTLSCASQRVEFSHPYLLYWLRRRCFLFYLHNQVLSNWNVIPEILTGLGVCSSQELLLGITQEGQTIWFPKIMSLYSMHLNELYNLAIHDPCIVQ